MKIGKQPKRWGKPSAKFLEKKAQEDSARAVVIGLDVSTKPDETRVTDIGIKLYLDDERPCPPGWTLCRSFEEFRQELFKDESYTNRITHISLDWYLGDKSRLTGYEAADMLGQKLFNGDDDNPYMPNLKAVGFHSSDPDQARRMANHLSEMLSLIGREDIRLRLHTPTL